MREFGGIGFALSFVLLIILTGLGSVYGGRRAADFFLFGAVSLMGMIFLGAFGFVGG